MQTHDDIRIVDFEPGHQASFKHLNEAWITRWFAMEEADHHALDHPDEQILAKGGHILIALSKDEPVGTCALLSQDAASFELAKMSVAEHLRGRGVGLLLGRAAIDRARQLGARRLCLESSTRLEPAINLYRKLGFREIQGAPSHFARCNIQMELIL